MSAIEHAAETLRRKIPSILPPVAEFIAREAFESIDREGMADRLEHEFGPYLAHRPAYPHVFWRSQADAILAWLRGEGS